MTKITAGVKKEAREVPMDPGDIAAKIEGSEVVAGNVLLGNIYLYQNGEVTGEGRRVLKEAGIEVPDLPPEPVVPNPPPTVASLAPTSGVDGDEVVITGTGFQEQGEHSQVKVGTADAVIVSWTPTEVIIAALQGTNVFDAPLAVWLRPNDKQDVNAGAFTFTTEPAGQAARVAPGTQGELNFDLEGVPPKKHK